MSEMNHIQRRVTENRIQELLELLNLSASTEEHAAVSSSDVDKEALSPEYARFLRLMRDPHTHIDPPIPPGSPYTADDFPVFPLDDTDKP